MRKKGEMVKEKTLINYELQISSVNGKIKRKGEEDEG